jgi:hypothetical protein
LAIIFSALFSGGVDKVIATTFNSADTIINNINSLEDLVLGILPKINTTFDQASQLVSYIPQFNGPLQNINDDVNGAVADLSAIKADLQNVQNQTNIVTTKLYWIAQVPQLSGVPTTTDIPSPSSDNYNMIDEAKNQLLSTQATISSTEALISNSTAKFKAPLQDAQNQVYSLASSSMGIVTTPVQQFKDIQNQYFGNTTQDAVKYYVNMAEKIRVTLMCVIVSGAMIMYAIMLMVAYPCKADIGGCFQASSCLTFMFAWVWFLIASVCFIIWAFTTDVCRSAEPAVFNVLNSTGLSISQTNQTIVSIAQRILTCSGDQDILTIVGIDLNTTLNFAQYNAELSQTLQNGLNQFNINSTLTTARSAVTQFTNQSSNLNLDFTSQIDLAFSKLANVTNQVQDLNTFGFNMTTYQGSLDNLNAYTLSVTSGVYQYSFQNVSSFNATTDLPYSSMSSSVKQEVNARQTVVLTLQVQYNITTTLTNAILANLTAVNNSLISINNSLNDADDKKDELMILYPVLLNAELDKVDVLSNQFKANVTTVANNILGILNGVVGTIKNVLGCGWLGSNYALTKDTICTSMAGYIGITGLSSQFIGLLMFAMFPFMIVGSKYFNYKNDNRNQFADNSSPMTGGVIELQEEDKGGHHHHHLERDIE